MGEERRSHRTPLSLLGYKCINGEESLKNSNQRLIGKLGLARTCKELRTLLAVIGNQRPFCVRKRQLCVHLPANFDQGIGWLCEQIYELQSLLSSRLKKLLCGLGCGDGFAALCGHNFLQGL